MTAEKQIIAIAGNGNYSERAAGQPRNNMKIAEIKKEIELASGKSIAQLEKIAKGNFDCDGDFAPVKIKSGISIVWVANCNYGQGSKNGYGIGLYAKLQMCGTGTQLIRLTQSVK